MLDLEIRHSLGVILTIFSKNDNRREPKIEVFKQLEKVLTLIFFVVVFYTCNNQMFSLQD